MDVNINNMKFSSTLTVGAVIGTVTCTRCYFTGTGTSTVIVSNYSTVRMNTCFSTTTTGTLNLYCLSKSTLNTNGCKIANANDSGRAAQYVGYSNGNWTAGTKIDGDAGGGNKATEGIRAYLGAQVDLNAAAGIGYCHVYNCDTGLRAYNHAGITYTTNVVYSNNGTDETATAGSFGYID
jgi:hypothetical protein